MGLRKTGRQVTYELRGLDVVCIQPRFPASGKAAGASIDIAGRFG